LASVVALAMAVWLARIEGTIWCTQADQLLIFGASVAEFDVQHKPADSVRDNYQL
jgi:hypothetical protein